MEKRRSQFFIRLVKSLLRRYHEYKMTKQYIRGYKRTPDTEEEAEAFLSIARISTTENPW